MDLSMDRNGSRQVQSSYVFWSSERVEAHKEGWGRGSKQDGAERNQRWAPRVKSSFPRVVQAQLEPVVIAPTSRSQVHRGALCSTWISPRTSRTLKHLKKNTAPFLSCPPPTFEVPFFCLEHILGHFLNHHKPGIWSFTQLFLWQVP